MPPLVEYGICSAMSSSHPFNPGDRKFPMLLPIGGMILLGITTTTLGFVCWPEPKPHHDLSTEGTFPPDAAPAPDPAAATPDPPRAGEPPARPPGAAPEKSTR